MFMRYSFASIVVIAALLLTACAGQAATPSKTMIPGTGKLEITTACTDQKTVMFDIRNTGDPIPSPGLVYRITDESGKVIKQGTLGLATDEVQSLEMEGAGPYTLIIVNENTSQKGECQ
jgi:hypothetical protein